MALSDGLRAGGIYFDVGLRFDQLDRDLSEVQRRVGRATQGMRVGVGVSGGQSSGGGGIAPLRPGDTPGTAVAAGLSAMAGAITGEIRAMAAQMVGATQGVVTELQAVVKNTATVASDVARTARVEKAFRFEEKGQIHDAQAGRLWGRAIGDRRRIERPTGFAGMRADVRATVGNVGFDQGPRVVRQAAEEVSQVARVVVEQAGQAAERAVKATRVRAPKGGFTHAGEFFRGGQYLSSEAAAAFQAGTPSGPTVAVGTSPRRRRSGFMGIDMGARLAGGAGAGMALGALAGGVAGPLGMGAGLLAGGVAGAAPDATAKAVAGLWKGFWKLEGAIASAGHAAAGFYNHTRAGNTDLARTLAVVSKTGSAAGAALLTSFRAVAAPLKLLGGEAYRVTGALGLMGGAAKGLTAPLMLPFTAARGAVAGLNTQLASTAAMLRMVGPVLALGFVAKGVKGAADLEQTISKVDITFGDAAGGVHAFAADLAERFGIVRGASLDAAAGIGNIALASKMTAAEGAELSKQMVKLAADLAARDDLGFGEALQKIRAGLVGEAEPLRVSGVLLSENAVKARAAAMGFEAVNGALAEGDKVKARAAIITEQLATAHGALEREAGTSTSMMRRLTGDITNTAVAVGQKLEPAFREMLLLYGDLRSGGTGAGSAIMGTLGAVGSAIKNTVHFIRQMVNNWDTAKELMGLTFLQLAENAGAAFGHVANVVGATGRWIYDNWRTIFTDLIEFIKTAVGNLAQNFKDLGKAFIQWIKDPLNAPLEFKFTPIMEGFQAQTPALELPEFKLPNSYAEQMGELIGKLTTAPLPGDGAQAATPKASDLVGTDPAESKEKERSRIGELIGARDLLNMMQGNARDRDKAANETAKNTRESKEHLGRMEILMEQMNRRGNVAVVG